MLFLRTWFSPIDSVCQYVHEVLVNRLGDLNLPRKSVVRLNDRDGQLP